MKTADDRRMERITAEIGRELDDLERLRHEFVEFREKYPVSDRFLIRAKATYLSDFYSGVEKIFKIIAQESGTGVPRGDAWHKRLLSDMTLAIGSRPPVISRDLERELAKFLGFRHVVRQAYGFELEENKIDELVEHYESTHTLFVTAIREFCETLLR